MDRKRILLKITGIVQGVGFRPTVYKYALESGITGYVLNDETGVTVEIEGTSLSTNQFLEKLKKFPPPLSTIESWTETSLPAENSVVFEIRKSTKKSTISKSAAISPDISICNDCLREIMDPDNRRYRYPFTNCTNCGPRFTIIRDRPYDRHLTSMSNFPMCPDCKKEYENPLDRRFHAQPNACPDCGPVLYIPGTSISGDIALNHCISGVQNGETWCVKGLGGFNIICDAFNKNAVLKLRKAKRRKNKSFALMAKNLNVMKNWVYVSEEELKLLKSPAAPIVLLRKNSEHLDHISPDNNYLGFLLPYTPFHCLLMEKFDALIFTSANLRDEPIAITDNEALYLKENGVVDNILTHNRDIVHRCDDSITAAPNGNPLMIRRSRGYVPGSFRIAADLSSASLALGANLKNTFSIGYGSKIWMGQHIGDLVEKKSFDFLCSQATDLTSLLDISPLVSVIDAHPGMELESVSNKIIPDAELKKVYHHHAHFFSVIGEHNLFETEVTGVSADGTGYGADGNIWGFEFLSWKPSGDNKLLRVASLMEFPLIGGDICITEISRIAYSLMKTSNLIGSDDLNPSFEFMLRNRINLFMTSSLGRLFDGVSSILGLCDYSEYEARGAILLQKCAESCTLIPETTQHLTVSIVAQDNQLKIDYRPMIRDLLKLKSSGISTDILARLFHVWVASSIKNVLLSLDVKTVALSGGVFQNFLLLEILENNLNECGISHFRNNTIPVNDGGISFGQLIGVSIENKS
ncbi:MAG: carbamoyltransferase HypF [Deltaproteobacteria bacterium]|nr:carbamoyltransferase HypF [Deltaproteobacteria bacterium]